MPDDVKPIGKLPAAKQADTLQLVLGLYHALNAKAEPFMTTDQMQRDKAVQAQCKANLQLLLQGLHGSKRVWQSIQKLSMVQMHFRSRPDMQNWA